MEFEQFEISSTESFKSAEFGNQIFPVPDDAHVLFIHRRLEINEALPDSAVYTYSLVKKSNTKVIEAYKRKIELASNGTSYPLIVKMFTAEEVRSKGKKKAEKAQ